MSATKEYIGNLQRRIANQRTEIEYLRSVKKRQAAEIETLRQRLAETENGYAQTLYLERLKNRDLTEENNRLSYWEQEKVKTVTNLAVNAFATRLKGIYLDKRYDRPNAHTMIICLFENIDNLVKEITGEQI